MWESYWTWTLLSWRGAVWKTLTHSRRSTWFSLPRRLETITTAPHDDICNSLTTCMTLPRGAQSSRSVHTFSYIHTYRFIHTYLFESDHMDPYSIQTFKNRQTDRQNTEKICATLSCLSQVIHFRRHSISKNRITIIQKKIKAIWIAYMRKMTPLGLLSDFNTSNVCTADTTFYHLMNRISPLLPVSCQPDRCTLSLRCAFSF